MLWSIRPTSDLRAGSAVRLDLAGLVDGSEIGLEGRVLSTRVELDALGRPYTRATLAVTRDLIGDSRGPFDVLIPGGVLPTGTGLLLPGMPALHPGEEVFLFLTEASATGVRVPVGLAQGKFRIERDANGGRTLVRDGAELLLLDSLSLQRTSVGLAAVYDYAAFMAEVQALAARRRSLAVPPAVQTEVK